MGLKPAYLHGVSDAIAPLYAQLEIDITNDIVRRIVKTRTFTVTANWQIEKAKQAGILDRKAIVEAAKANGISDSTIQKAFRDASLKAMEADDAIHMKAGADLVPLNSSLSFRQTMVAGIHKTEGLLSNFTLTTAQTANRAFVNLMDRAYLQVTSGAFSFDEALRRTVSDLVSEGYTKIAYPSGGIGTPEAAARRALITGINQTTAQLQLARADEAGCDLVEVSAHAGARPSHAIWQGKIYSRSGKHTKYGDFVSNTGYGSGDGLCGWNCYHSFYPYYEGTPRAFADDQYGTLTENNAVYEESQHQRSLETAVRKSKRELSILDSAFQNAASPELKNMLEKHFTRASVTYSNRTARLNNFLDKTGRRSYSDRLYIPNYGRSVSSRAAWAAKKAQ